MPQLRWYPHSFSYGYVAPDLRLDVSAFAQAFPVIFFPVAKLNQQLTEFALPLGSHFRVELDDVDCILPAAPLLLRSFIKTMHFLNVDLSRFFPSTKLVD